MDSALASMEGYEMHKFRVSFNGRKIGAGGSVGLVIEDGPMPLRPSPTEQAGPDNSRE